MTTCTAKSVDHPSLVSPAHVNQFKPMKRKKSQCKIHLSKLDWNQRQYKTITKISELDRPESFSYNLFYYYVASDSEDAT